MYAGRAAEGREGAQIPLHSENHRGGLAHPEDRSSSEGEINNDGTWGENEQGGPVNCSAAMQDYDHLRKHLTHLSRNRSQRSSATAHRNSLALRRILTNASRRPQKTGDEDIEAHGEDERLEEIAVEDEDEFMLGGFLTDGHFEERDSRGSSMKVGMVYKNLTVQGTGANSTYVKTLPSAVMGVSICLYSLTQCPKVIYLM